VLAENVLQSPALARWPTFVVQHADDGAIVDERFEEDRARVRDDAVAVLEEDRELLEVSEARGLDEGAGTTRCSRKTLLPLTVARVGATASRVSKIFFPRSTATELTETALFPIMVSALTLLATWKAR
jgi:hypothetical protein